MGCRFGKAKLKAIEPMTDPLTLFDQWFAEARASEPNDAEAMTLATADADGRPAARMVLLKGHGPDGFIFYTNEQSAKGDQLAANPKAALLFHWKSLRRQVRIEGRVDRVPDAEADAYFATRGRDSQLGAWASDQSRPLDSRDDVRAALRSNQGPLRRAGRATSAPLARLSRDPRPDRILERPSAPAP